MATNLNFLCFACSKASFTVFIICLFLSGRLIVTQTNRRAREWRGPSTWRSSLILMLNLEGGGAWYSKSVKTFIWGMGLSLSDYLLHFPLSCVFPAPQPILSLPSFRRSTIFGVLCAFSKGNTGLYLDSGEAQMLMHKNWAVWAALFRAGPVSVQGEASSLGWND